MKPKGPRIEPCGNPELINLIVDLRLLFIIVIIIITIKPI